MHLVSNYDLIVSRPEEDAEREVLLLAAEWADVPQSLGSPESAQWVKDGEENALDVLFHAQDGTQTPVRFTNITPTLAEKLAPFDRVMLVWLGDNGIVGEEDIPLTA